MAWALVVRVLEAWLPVESVPVDSVPAARDLEGKVVRAAWAPEARLLAVTVPAVRVLGEQAMQDRRAMCSC